MEKLTLSEAKEKFIQAWGALGSNWGISRTMAQIHALLLVSVEPLSAEDIMQTLGVSRGNVNMTLRELIDWGLVKREHKPGERKEFFVAEKNIFEAAKMIARERRKRELEPLLKVIAELKQVSPERSDDYDNFRTIVRDVERFAKNIDAALEKGRQVG
ncbi:MAG: helix-turn-helix domain-containing protein [Chloroherpetonaceae bacterium]|nr:helix-turn-helix domain-containing protein [Chloroherpetonaceae bacterium]